MTDEYGSFTDNVSSPANHAVAVTPHATNPLPFVAKALYVGGAGNVTLRAKGDAADVTFVGVPAGTILPVRAAYVRASGTTATNIVALG
jgi:hypothetical protein